VVSPQGNDTNVGTLEKPWKTLKKAADTAQAGDLVLIRGGTYAEQLAPVNNCKPTVKDQILTANIPAETLPIVFAAYPHEKPVLNGSGVSLTKVLQNARFNGLVHVNGCHDIWVIGLTVQNSADMGLYTYNSNRIKFIDNSTYNTRSSGIAAWYSRNVLIDGNEVNKASTNTSNYQENISIGEKAQQFDVRYNHVHHGGYATEGLDVKDGSSNGTVHHNYLHDMTSVCLYLDAWDKVSENIEFHSNVIHDCEPYNGISLAAEQGGTIRNIRVYNNLIYRVKQNGVHVGAGYHHPAENIYIYNNTFYENGYTTTGFGASIVINNTKAKNIVIRNNLGASTDAQIINVSKNTSVTIENNLFARPQDKWNNETYGTNHVIGDPLFENAAARDFRLKAGSPAIGKANPIMLPAFDFAGQPN
jgi:post-segregation antitoxin (ccd killing protein)